MTYYWTITGIAVHDDPECIVLLADDITVKTSESFDDVPDRRSACGFCDPDLPSGDDHDAG